MRTIIAGTREIEDYEAVRVAMELAANRGIEPTRIVSGMARGVDMLGVQWAAIHHKPIDPYPVSALEWKTVGRSAGHRRNMRMAKNADACVVIWDNHSPGSKSMIQQAEYHGLKLFVFDYPRWLRGRMADSAKVTPR